MEVQEIIRDYFENLYSNKFENLKEMDRFLDTIKREIHQKEVTIINLYATNIRVSNFNKHKLKDLKAHKIPTERYWEILISLGHQ
jgi:glycine betaine/choline ABC-type transport system substrate-binding protein